MPEVGSRSRRVIEESYPKIVWEHSHVVVDKDGTVFTYCVYDAPNQQMVRDHSAELGLLAGPDEVVDRPARLAGVAPVARQRGRDLAHLGRRVLEEARDRRMPFLAPRPRQQLVGDLADQHVLEAVLLLALDDRPR